MRNVEWRLWKSHLKHCYNLAQHRFIIGPGPGERFDTPEGTETEGALFATDTIVRLVGVVVVDQIL